MPSSPPRVRLSSLGALSARREGAGETDALVGQPALLFTYLVDRGAAQPRSELATLFWPDVDAARARHGLRQALSRIRKVLGAEVLVGSDPVAVDGALVDWDVDDFTAALQRSDLAAALDLCHGVFLNGAAGGLSWELSEWVDRRRRELEGMLLDAGRGAVRALTREEDFEAALSLADRLQECVPGDRGLAVDAAELLVELGRPHEAEARLAGIDADPADARVAGLRKRVRRTEPGPVAPAGAFALPGAEESPEPVVPDAETEVPADPAPHPTPPLVRPRSARRRGRRRAGAALGAVALAAILIGFFRPAPLADVSIWFCGQRETRHGFVVDLPEGTTHGVLTEPGCPILPLGADSLLVVRGYDDPEMRLELEGPAGTRVVYRAARIASRIPFRAAGRQDGVVSPDGRTVVLGVERPDRPRETDPALGDLADEGPLPGVEGLRRDPPADWDVVVVDVASGAARSIGPDDANLWDARFAPDGRSVVYVSDASGNGDLYRTDLISGGTVRLTRDPRMARHPVVGRRWTVFQVGSGTDEDPEQIMVLDNETGEVTARFPTSWNQSAPDLSPDERHLCWTSKERGHWEADIVVADLEGRGPPRRLTPAGRDDYCQWVDDERVLYRSWRTGDEELFLQGRRRWSRPRNLTLFDGQARAPFVVGG